MSDNFTYKYASGAEVTLRATEDASSTPSVYTPHVNAQTVDADGTAISSDNPLPVTATIEEQTTSGGQGTLVVADWEAGGSLEKILKELKIMNLHLSLMTDNQITKLEVE